MYTFITIARQNTELLVIDKNFDWEASKENLIKNSAFGEPQFNMVRDVTKKYDNVVLRPNLSWFTLRDDDKILTKEERKTLEFKNFN